MLTFLAILSALPTRAQWLPVQGMDGESVTSAVTKDSLVFISSSNGVFVRPITGGEWNRVFPFQSFSLINSGNFLFSMGYSPYLFRSGDNGQTWDSLLINATCIRNIGTTLFGVQSLTPNNDFNVCRSDDNGVTWYSSSPAGTDAVYLFTNDSVLMMINFVPEIWYSTDMGLTWDTLSIQGLPWLQVPCVEGIMDIFYYNSEFWISVSQGTYKYNATIHQWQLSIPEHFTWFIEYLGNLCGGGNGFFRYDTLCNFWTELSTGLMGITKGLCKMDTLLFNGTDIGPFRTEPSMIWQPWYDGLHGGEIYSFASNASEVWVSSSIGLFKSTDEGSSFVRVIIEDVPYFLHLMITDSTYYGCFPDLWESVDHGITWTMQNQGLDSGSRVHMVDGTSNYLFARTSGCSWAVYRSAYNPIFWNEVPNVIFDKVFAAHDTTIILGSLGLGPLCFSHDNLATFDSVAELPEDTYNYVKYKNDHFLCIGFEDIYYSEDDGNSWSIARVTENPDFTPLGFSIKEGTILLAGGMYLFGEGMVFKSLDNGATWININTNLQSFNHFSDVYTVGDRIFLSTSSIGLWYRDDIETGLWEYPTNNPLLKIFPVPAVDEVRIESEIKLNTSYTIKIHDLFGKIVYSEKYSSISEKVRNIISVKDFPRGIYLVTLESGSETYCGKLIVQ